MKRYVAIGFCTLLCCVLLAACAGAGEQYEKVGKTDAEQMNDQIPGEGYAELETPTTGPEGSDVPTKAPTATPEVTRSFTVVLDAGHGGAYSGAVYDGRIEKTLNLQLVYMIREYLNEHYPNVTVLLTREGDAGLSESLADDLRLRVELAKNAGADALLSIHFNASDNHTQKGSMVCVSKQPHVNARATQLADCILQQLEPLGFANNGAYMRSSTDTYDENGVPVDYYAINRHGANMELVAIIVENCFMDHPDDIARFDTEEEMMQIAKADAEGLMQYLNGLEDAK